MWPSLFVFFLQAFQIDIDHWRHVFLLLGGVWGLETARVRWQNAEAAAGARSSRPGGRRARWQNGIADASDERCEY